ncbi:Isocitrate dehydrogenase phosphatase (EC /kinase (EC [Olavius algarvensis associated proteobacterium Delta 3]|nr:Isocitrate dehydrogenase phosphatase (EC /kinase (EC [Olavius algarvensis associated proteobacterium Delta 3]
MTATNHDMEPETATEIILDAFREYQYAFDRITLMGRDRFIERDWRGAHQDVVERIELYRRAVEQVVSSLKTGIGSGHTSSDIGRRIKTGYLRAIADRNDIELAKTFFNSAIRRVFETIGVDSESEFVDTDFDVLSVGSGACPECRLIAFRGSIRSLVEDIFNLFDTKIALADPRLDFELATEEINSRFGAMGVDPSHVAIEVHDSIFYRNKAAYIIGRVLLGQSVLPLVIALLNEDEGIYVDAVLLTEEEISVLFSFTRSYFRVRAERPWELVRFIKTLIPSKPVSEIYTSIGYHKHGKAELFRELQRSLHRSNDKFMIAPGEKGMVMVVFTLPSFDVVFKVIKDRFDYPKKTDRRAVRERYQLVFRHDRAGRLIDAQEFEYLKIGKDRFSDRLLSELRKSASRSVDIGDHDVVLRHVYTERRITPLDIYVREAGESEARDVVRDYGNAIKDLAATNIFPGDLFLKNFGVTRHGRVIFYDYDELCLLLDCRFKTMPPARSIEEEMSAEPWFYVDENDVFPEEFGTFFRLRQPLRQVFAGCHGDLLQLEFWQHMQEKLRSGDVLSIFPYHTDRRLRQRARNPRRPNGR